jgi:hypothetical protein
MRMITINSFCNQCSCSILQDIRGYRNWRNINLILLTAAKEKLKEVKKRKGREVSGKKVDSHGCTITQTTVDIWWQSVILQKNFWFVIKLGLWVFIHKLNIPTVDNSIYHLAKS